MFIGVLLLILLAVYFKLQNDYLRNREGEKKIQGMIDLANSDVKFFVTRYRVDPKSKTGVDFVINNPDQVFILGEVNNLKRNGSNGSFDLVTTYRVFSVSFDNTTKFTLTNSIKKEYLLVSSSDINNKDYVAIRSAFKSDFSFKALEVQKIIN